MEPVLWSYAWGRPPLHIEVSRADEPDLSTMSYDELQQHAQSVLRMVEDARAIEAAIDVSENAQRFTSSD